MRTTLDIAEDVLAAAKELSRRKKISREKIVSSLLRVALSGQTSTLELSSVTVRGFDVSFVEYQFFDSAA